MLPSESNLSDWPSRGRLRDAIAMGARAVSMRTPRLPDLISPWSAVYSMPISQLSCESSYGSGVAACAVACSHWGDSALHHDAALFAGRELEGVIDPRCYRAVFRYGPACTVV